MRCARGTDSRSAWRTGFQRTLRSSSTSGARSGTRVTSTCSTPRRARRARASADTGVGVGPACVVEGGAGGTSEDERRGGGGAGDGGGRGGVRPAARSRRVGAGGAEPQVAGRQTGWPVEVV